MSKYNFEVDLSQNSSTGIILSKIARGSTVLEFGCAAGRMTRYMKEALDCQVYIVEYDKQAYESALNYAKDGLCDDIMNFQWVDRFKGVEFDAITFADVLEHLPLPEKVLETASSLLKETGFIHASIPNITHNDILLKAYEERFDYTPTGLLDDTHIHFWGMKNLEDLAHRSGLHIVQVGGTYCPTGYTEQYEHTDKPDHFLLENILRERSCGEVYQYVITFQKNKGPNATYTLKAPSIQSHVYLDTGNGFNSNEVIPFASEYSGHGVYTAHCVIDNPGNIRAIRFDPIEFQACFLQNIMITQGGQPVNGLRHDGLEARFGIFLFGNDPMIYADVLSREGPVIVDAEIILGGEQFLRKLQDALVSKNSEDAKTLETLGMQINHLTADIDGLIREKELLQGTIAHTMGEKKQLEGTIARMSKEIEELGKNLGAYITLSNYKDLIILNLKREMQYYQNLRVIRIRAYIVRIVKGIKRRLKRFIRKEEH